MLSEIIKDIGNSQNKAGNVYFIITSKIFLKDIVT